MGWGERAPSWCYGWLLCSALLYGGCGAEEDDKDTSTASASYTFTADIAPIIKASCAQNNSCHEAANTQGNMAYEGNKDLVLANKYSIIERINQSDTALKMPQTGSGLSLSEGDKKKLESYLGQSKHD